MGGHSTQRGGPYEARELREVVEVVNRVPDRYRVFSATREEATRIHRIPAGLLDDLLDLGVPTGPVDRGVGFDPLDLANIALRLGIDSPQRRSLSHTATAIQRALDGRQDFTVDVMARCPDGGHDGPCDFAVEPTLSDAAGVLAVTELAPHHARIRLALPGGDQGVLPDTPAIRDLVGSLDGVEFHKIPAQLAGELSFLRDAGLADCRLASNFLVERGRRLGLEVQTVYGVVVAPPLSTNHWWIELRTEHGWVAADPFFLTALARWGIVDASQWPPTRIPPSIYWAVGHRRVPFITHRGTEVHVSLVTRSGARPTGPGRSRLPLNTAQLRNLRNWAEAELPAPALTVLAPVVAETAPETARAVLGDLAARHEALRSRLVRDGASGFVQEVLDDPSELLRHELVEIPDAVDPAGWVEDYPADRVDPREGPAAARVFVHQGRVRYVRLTVSHMFCDSMGQQALAHELRLLLAGEEVTGGPPRQARDFAGDRQARTVRENTDYWKSVLRDAPRSCTYAGMRRERTETAETAWSAFDAGLAAEVARAARRSRSTPYCVWAAAISVLVEAMTGRADQVFRSTYANRRHPADFGAVVQLAQAVFVPLPGRPPGGTLRDRCRQVMGSTLATYARGTYDANGLLDWLNRPENSAGALFQPAFELNYIPAWPGAATGRAMDRPVGSHEAPVRIDPAAAKGDLAVSVLEDPAVVYVTARNPVRRRGGAGAVRDDLLKVVRAICATPEADIGEVIGSLGTVAPPGLRHGHRSGVSLDLDVTRELITSFPGVQRCELDLTGPGTTATLAAEVVLNGPVDRAELMSFLRQRQPWFAGSVVPDRLSLITGSEESHGRGIRLSPGPGSGQRGPGPRE